MTANPTPPAVLDHDARTITLAVTFSWQRGWALDKCEAGALPRDVARAIADSARDHGPLAEWVQLGALESIRTWDPDEEIELGRWVPRVRLHEDESA